LEAAFVGADDQVAAADGAFDDACADYVGGRGRGGERPYGAGLPEPRALPVSGGAQISRAELRVAGKPVCVEDRNGAWPVHRTGEVVA
jgi:hypothetical protein